MEIAWWLRCEAIGGDVAELGTAGLGHAGVQLLGQQLQHVGHAQRTRHGQGVHLQAADEHGVGAQCQGLEGVGAAAHAAVQQHGVALAHGGAHGGQAMQGRGCPVQAAPAVVGDDEAGRAHRLQRAGVVGVHDALDPYGQAGLAQQPAQVVPGRGVAHGALEDAAVVRAQSGRRGRWVGRQVGGRAVGGHHKTRLQRAAAGQLDAGVQREHDGAVARGLGAAQQGERVFSLGLQVQLEPARGAGGTRDRLQRARRQRAGHQAGARGLGGAGGGDFCLGVGQALVRHRGQQQRVGQVQPTQREPRVAAAHVAQQARHDGPGGEGGAVGGHRAVPAAAAGHIGKTARVHVLGREPFVVDGVPDACGNMWCHQI